VFKKGNRNVMDNYRPVSLTSHVCKLFESIIRDSMVRYLEDNGLIRDSQYWFRKGRSCLSNLLSFMDKVSGYLDSGEPVDAIFLDFAKAFDKVAHRRLARKLAVYVVSLVRCYSGWRLGWQTGSSECVSMVPCLHGSWL